MSKTRTDFDYLMLRLKHLEKMVSSYGELEDWEKMKKGDPVVINNTDSLHHGRVGKFLTHEWSSSGFCELIVEFPTGSCCVYSPRQVVVLVVESIPESVAESVADSVLKSLAELEAESLTESVEEPEKKVVFKTTDQERNDEKGLDIIEAKLVQIAKIPKAARLSVLSSTLDRALLDRAKALAKDRGIL